jgi:hypothetical protein
MRGAWCAAAVALGLTGLLAGAPATAHSSTRAGCVTKAEFAKVQLGMRSARVHRIFGTEGADTGLGAPNHMRYYDVCRAAGMVQVTYNPQDRVVSKSGSWYR